ncbi:MAG TPA: CHRD domain-containing protein [Casimicrobiaceae bacterium]|nr:CHRD domain-containing protein [Casimicrobiaceae bacterium]
MSAITAASIAYGGALRADEITVTLSGTQEIPPVTTAASGTGTLTVGPDKSISGKLTVTGMAPTVAHIHEGAPGANGPIIVPLTKAAEGTWVLPAGVKLTDAQFESYRSGKLYFNVHSEAHRSGEIRGQIKP